MSSQQISLKDTQQQKLKEVQSQQAKLKILQNDLEKLNVKIGKNEELAPEDTEFISELGWLSALSVSIVAAAAVL